MIEAIAKIGEIELAKIKEQGGNELELFIDKPFRLNENIKQEVVVLNVSIEDKTIKLKEIEIERYPFNNEYKFLYKKASSRGGDFSFTTRYTFNKKEGFINTFKKFFDRFKANILNYEYKLDDEDTIKKSLNERLKNYLDKDNVFVTLKISGKYLGDDKAFVDKFYVTLSDSFAFIDGDLSQNKNAISYIENNLTTVLGGGMSISFPFYTTDKPGFAYGLKKTNSVKMLPLSSKDSKNLIAGKNYLDTSFRHTYAGQWFYLVPTFYNSENSKLIKTFARLSKLYDLRSEIEDVEDKENGLLAELAKTEDYTSFNLLFFKEENSALRIIKLVEEVFPSRIRTILEAIEKTNRNIKEYDLTTESWSSINFEQKIIYDIFSQKDFNGKTKSNEKFFEILEAVFKNKDLNYNLILHILLKKMQTALYSSGMKKNIYRQTVECLITYLFLVNLNILRKREDVYNNQSNKNGGVIMENRYMKSLDRFFDNYGRLFDRSEYKWLFSLGFLISRVRAEQYKRLKSTPVMNKLKGLKLRKKDLLRTKTDIEGKAREYGIPSALFESADFYLLQINNDFNRWNISDDEVNFYISLGINLQNCIWQELNKLGEEISTVEKTEENLEVQ